MPTKVCAPKATRLETERTTTPPRHHTTTIEYGMSSQSSTAAAASANSPSHPVHTPLVRAWKMYGALERADGADGAAAAQPEQQRAQTLRGAIAAPTTASPRRIQRRRSSCTRVARRWGLTMWEAYELCLAFEDANTNDDAQKPTPASLSDEKLARTGRTAVADSGSVVG